MNVTQSKHTPGPWRIGKYPSTIVSSSRVETTRATINNDGGVNDVEYYGGSLIAESVLRHENAKLIAAAPAMLEVLAQLVHCNDEDELGCIITSAKKVLSMIEGNSNG
ncbi:MULTISPECIES: hypothetical protein [Bacillus subtilis group]|uniref:hypothetical protein n=1 Tax=Bacillus subtilis group TaxID=653685 RepID=UPI001A91ABDB|nr:MULTISPECIES: hypothetical protein [Bacillus subtilis group]BCT30325.1 hypothetical protein BVAD3_39990 [Bacillus velezensis]